MDAARVDQLALVHAYYGGRARVATASLQIPQQAYFHVSATPASNSDAAPRSERALQRASRKRKRHDDQQQALIAAGKFVPVPDDLVRALAQAHSSLLQYAESSDDAQAADVAVSQQAPTSRCERCTCMTTLHEPPLTVDALHANATDSVQVAHTWSGTRVLLPPRSHFACTDVRALHALPLGRFELIVMDPPWANKSVARGKQYVTFHHSELLKLDVAALADPRECVLGIWVTNRPQLTAFVVETLLPAWGFSLHDTWYWLKVCANGDLVTPLTSSHRLPFEKLLVAYRCADRERARTLRTRLGDTPKLRMSAPLRHSWKPPPESFFDTASSARKLELFARELRCGWTSVGNEVLKFQARELFDVCAAHPDSAPGNASETHT